MRVVLFSFFIQVFGDLYPLEAPWYMLLKIASKSSLPSAIFSEQVSTAIMWQEYTTRNYSDDHKPPIKLVANNPLLTLKWWIGGYAYQKFFLTTSLVMRMHFLSLFYWLHVIRQVTAKKTCLWLFLFFR